ncbi:hypothetical protein [Streptomyces noursei]
MLKALTKIADRGGLFQSDAPKSPYAFPGGTHLNIDQDLQDNLWRFRLTSATRDVLDHFTVNHDDEGIIHTTQGALAQHFGCSQASISKAIKVLSSHHFAWKVRKSQYRLNPTYSYRFSSAKHQALVLNLKDELKQHVIVVPTGP